VLCAAQTEKTKGGVLVAQAWDLTTGEPVTEPRPKTGRLMGAGFVSGKAAVASMLAAEGRRSVVLSSPVAALLPRALHTLCG
jgi:hypothetical protein